MNRGTVVSRRAVLVAAVALVTAGCADAADPASQAELVWATGGISSADRDRSLDIAARWNTLHSNGPKVRVEPLSLSTDEQRQLLALELNAGLPQLDILSLDVVWIPEFAQRDWLVDLQNLRPEIEQVSLPGPMQAGVWNGKLWAAPDITDAGILYYRSDLVDKPPITWEELIDVGRRVGEQNGIAPFVADGAQYEGLVVQYLEYFWGLGGDVLGRDGQSVLFQTDKALYAAEFMHKAFREGVYAPGFNTMDLEEARKTFQAGEAVFLRSWPYIYQQMNGKDPASQIAGKVGIAPLPAFNGRQSVAALGGHNLAVSAFSRNVPAATEFVRFVSTSPDVQRRLALQHSLAPTMAAVYHDLAGDPMMALLAKVLPTAKPRPATPEWATVSAEMQQQIFAAYTGIREPTVAVEALRNFLVATVESS
ncbi:MAG: ABC transporter substrate-binding protein [Actinomycetota bacterium]|nr:ABC transporter substrate-binding protein [Actinomycetota bacterium]